MNLLFMLNILLWSPAGFASFDGTEVPWLEALKKSNIYFFNVCGSADIQPNKKSLNRDFVLGKDSSGYFFTKAPMIGEYWSLIREHPSDEAKRHLQARFGDTHLWKYTADGKLVDLGVPTQLDFPFKATIKDCLAGTVNSMGYECRDMTNRESCCSEKFVGPNIFWGAKQEYALFYSPDPSVRLRVKNEAKHRFCNFQQIIEVKGSGR